MTEGSTTTSASTGRTRSFGDRRREGAPSGTGGAPPRRSGGRPPRVEKEWIPITKLGRLVKDGKIRSIEEIYTHALPIKEVAVIDQLFPEGTLKEEVMKIMPVQKQTQAGQRTRFKAIIIIGDSNGHVGFGVKVAKEVALAIRGAMVNAKLSLAPVRRGYWGSQIGEAHTVPVKVTGRCGSSLVRLIPAPRGTGIVAATAPKRLLQLAGISDCYTCTRGKTRTMGNFLSATFQALLRTYSFLTPDFWAPSDLSKKSPYQEHSDHLMKADARKPTA